MINPAAAMKVMKAKNQFVSNHPKCGIFPQRVNWWCAGRYDYRDHSDQTGRGTADNQYESAAV